MNTLTNRAPALTTHRPAAGLGTKLRRAARALWQALEAQGQDRARRHLLDLARQSESLHPDLARELRAASRSIG